MAEIFNCKYCGKECKNNNSLAQHETRCPQNENRKDFDRFKNYTAPSRKGKNKYNCEAIAKQVATVKEKYANGYESPLKGKHIEVSYIYEDHNKAEIAKWQDYVKLTNVMIPEVTTIDHPEGYKIIAKSCTKENNTVKYKFEHNYVAEYLMGDKLNSQNTVHHLDSNRSNNNPMNLVVFETKADHKRYHNSKYAYLIYDENTHKFTCIKKDK